MLEANKNKFLVGKVSDYTKRKGWFFGHFAEENLLQSDLVEVAYQDISNTQPAGDKHLHTSSVEINIVVSGVAGLKINGEEFTFHKGEFWIIWPETVVEDFWAKSDTQLVVVRAPSI